MSKLITKLKIEIIRIAYFLSRILIRRLILEFYKNSKSRDILPILEFLRKNRAEMISYDFINEYKQLVLTVYEDKNFGYNYVLVDSHKIYFPKDMAIEEIKQSVVVGMIEQDDRSPHCYLSPSLGDIGGEAAIICGASDCLFALKIIDKFKNIYLFEVDPKWYKPMQLTLGEYLDKVEIIPKFISDYDDEANRIITLDTFWMQKNYPAINYIQADIENNEIGLLHGASKVLRNSNLKMSLCCYHTYFQDIQLKSFLDECGYSTTFSSGYVVIWTDFSFRKPYLRKAVIYATK